MPKTDVIIAEIKWCEEHAGESGKGAEFEKAFVEGLRQAHRLMSHPAQLSDIAEPAQEHVMKAFIRDLFDIYYPDCGDIDGEELQDLAEKHGILVPEIRHQPCGEFCNCNQVCGDEEWKEGVKCYRLANWLQGVLQK